MGHHGGRLLYDSIPAAIPFRHEEEKQARYALHSLRFDSLLTSPGLAPLHIAARFREPEVIYALMAKDDTTVLDASGEGRLASDYAVDAEKGNARLE